MKVTFQQHLFVGFVLVAGLPLIAASLGFQQALSKKQSLEAVVEQEQARAIATGRLEAAQLQMSRRQKDLVLTKRASLVEPAVRGLQEARDRVRRAVAVLESFSPRERNPRLDLYVRELDAYDEIVEEIVPLIRERSAMHAAELAMSECKPAYRSLDETLERLLKGLIEAAHVRPETSVLTAIQRVTGLRAAVAEAHSLTRDYLLAQKMEAEDILMARVHDVLARFEERRALLRKTIPPAFREQLARVERRLERWLPIFRKIVALAGRQTERRAVALSVGPGGDRIITMSETLAAIVANAEAGSERARAQARAADDEARGWALVALLVAAVTALLAGFWLSASVVHQKGLERLTKTLAGEVETRREAEKSALAASRAKSEFLAMMSHEVRTPLNGILGSAALLTSSELSDEQLDNAQTIESCGRSLLTVLNDILDYSKIEAGKLSIERISFPLESNVQRAVGLQDANARAKGLDLALVSDTSTFPKWVKGDPSRLSQVLNNLIGNAVKFTPSGRIEVSVETRGRKLRFQVSDTGIGINPEARARLFRPFEQADSRIARRFGGTGLGLSISRRLVEMMGGEIGVDSEPGGGSRFWFVLPFEEAAAPAASHAPGAKGSLPTRVLVVDDNAVNRKVAARMLQRAGVEVFVADSGQEALERLDVESVDLVLMDVQMPGMDGLEATRRIRANDRHGGLPVVGLSANALAHQRQEGLDAGMSDYLTKPFSIDDVTRCWAGLR